MKPLIGASEWTFIYPKTTEKFSDVGGTLSETTLVHLQGLHDRARRRSRRKIYLKVSTFKVEGK